MQVIPASINDIESIITIAYNAWPPTYSKIVSEEQINFMLNKFYNKQVLTDQITNTKDNIFFKLVKEEELLGYAHILQNVEKSTCKLSKLYFNLQYKGKGYGKYLLAFVEAEMAKLHYQRLILNVNRANPAVEFYKKMGYQIIETQDIPLDEFWLNDYIMAKSL